MTLISVIIPCFNRASSIRESVLSVLNQSNSDEYDLEVIVVDDGSTDLSLNKISDLNIKIISTGGRRGACFARNLGVEHASGEWIAFNDSDDFWRVDKLKVTVDTIKKLNDSVDYLVHPFIRGCEGKYRVGGIAYNKDTYLDTTRTLRKLLKNNFISTQCLIVRKKTLDSIGGFDERLPRFQDWELAIRLAVGFNGYYINDCYVTCIDSNDSISTGYKKGIWARKYIINKHTSLYKNDWLSRVVFKWGIHLRNFVYVFIFRNVIKGSGNVRK